jgi:PAS domain S-box-containing protein
MSTSPAEFDQKLRQVAEEKLAISLETNSKTLSPADSQRLLHELQVYRIELEMQNEELRQTLAEKDKQNARLVAINKQTEQALHKQTFASQHLSYQEFHSLVESMPQLVWATRPDGWNIYFNQQWVNYTGLTLEESYGHGWNAPFHPEDKQRAWEAWQRATQNNARYSLECRLRRADGVYRWWLIRGEPMRAANGEVLKWFGTCTDIEELKTAEAALLQGNEQLEQRVAERTTELTESEHQFRVLIQNLQSGVALINADGVFTIVNPAFLRIFELDNLANIKNVNDHDWSQWQVFDEFGALLDVNAHPVRQAAQTGKAVQDKLIAMNAPGNHQRKWLLVSAEPILDAQGHIYQLICTYHDVTDRKLAEMALLEREKRLTAQAEQLRENNRHKDEFLAMLSHELRNPLAPIRNAVEIQKRAGADISRISWCTGIIDRQLKQLTGLVDDLLDVSRINRGQIELKKEILEIRDFIPLAVESNQPLIEARQHNFSLKLPAEPLWVEGDRIRLAQIVSNLINNAAKYTQQAGSIQVLVQAFAEKIFIHVTDNGYGIDQLAISQLFDLFYQDDHSIHHSQGGLGIGLSLVRRLVDMHGGDVQAFSTGKGQGSEFVVSLPRLFLPETEPLSGKQLADRMPNKLRILVVDDNCDITETLAILLGNDGHQVLTANNSHTALEIAKAERPDVILLDIGLPEMNGHELAQEIRRNRELDKTLLLALTGYGQIEERQKSQASGFNYHLVKPLDSELLRSILSEYKSGSVYKTC